MGFRVSGTYSFEPHGKTFNQPVQINCEYDVIAAAEAGGQLVFYTSKDSLDGPWIPVEGGSPTFRSGFASVQTFSFRCVCVL